jgi:ubiquinone/menaquinone biosynthesis C-methylase UbiE
MDSIENIHQKKVAAEYFKFHNQQIVKLLPENPGRILDIGCATGVLGAHIIETKKPEFYEGIEVVAEIAKEAEKCLSKVYLGQAEQWLPKLPAEHYDWVIMADSLEHTVDPWSVLGQVYRVLKKEGNVLISIPNVRNLGVITELLVRGSWKYRDFGIMDQGHLRFFTKRSIVEMLDQQGFKVNIVYSNPVNRWKKLRGRTIARMISLAIGQPSAYDELITVQWILSAEKRI